MIDIIYEDKAILVVKKQAGMAVQTKSFAQKDLESEVRNYLRGDDVYVVHRLDQPVEGLIVFAKTKKAAASLSKQFSDSSAHKVYTAYVTSSTQRQVSAKEIKLTDYLVKIPRENIARVSDEKDKNAKKAELTYCVVEHTGNTVKAAAEKGYYIYKLSIRLFTGRFHQIRAQLSNAGMPIVGDVKYGGIRTEEAQKVLKLSRGAIALSAVELSFKHPESGKVREFIID